ncbi:MAG: Gfo/Idh/MocA family oxidoreductase [Planctomycetales bacterium]|nr:Gfo/Idh/MocA family oxidoreductase [Planctomycetales bacterium]
MTPSSRRAFTRQFGAATAAALSFNSMTAFCADDTVRRPPLKIGQIGTRHAHASKLSVYRDSPDYEVVGVVEPDSQQRQLASRQPVYRDLPWMTQEQLLNVPGLDAVLIETEVSGLLEAASAAVSAGKHIHLDKPAGESLPKFRQLLQAAEQQRLLVQMGYMYRYNPAVVLLKKFLQEGWLGEIFEVHTVMSKVIDAASRRQLGEYPGGTMFELGCHIIDLVIGVLGGPNRITPYPRRVIDADDKLVDNMLAVFEYPRATATVRSSATEVEGFARRHFVVCGTGGTFHIQPLDNPSARVALSEPRGDYKRGYQEVTFPKYSRYVGDAADMAAVIRGEKPNYFSYAHDLTVQTAVLQAAGLPTT